MIGAASLGMYDGPALGQANDALWEAIAVRLVERGLDGVPPRLDRERSLDEIWSDPGLLLAQCCGYPLVTRYRDHLRYIATPHYTAPGCAGGSYRSRIVVRHDDPAAALGELRGRRAAINERGSNSGMNLFRAAIAPIASGSGFFAEVVETGSHRASVHAVADGRADVAAIDAVSFQHIARGEPALARRVRTLAWSEASPGLPFVTSRGTPEAIVAMLHDVLAEVACSADARPARELLLLDKIERLPAQDYDAVRQIERRAARLDYPVLR